MPASIVNQITERVEQAASQYFRLVLVVAPAGAGKTMALQHLAREMGIPLLNVNLEISRLLLDLTQRQRALQLPRLLGELADNTGAEVLFLDNTEILFDPALRQDPLRLLQGVSRNRTVVATWNGVIEGGNLVYARPDHAEYRKYPVCDFLAVSPEVSDDRPGYRKEKEIPHEVR
jgi:hypothetical protein